MPVPGNGYCLIYSAIASAPELIRDRLIAAGVRPDSLPANWLGDPDRVREASVAQAVRLASGENAVVPPRSPLNLTADLIRKLVLRFLDDNRNNLPAAVERYRLHLRPAVARAVRTTDAQTLAANLVSIGRPFVDRPGYVAATELRARYISARTAELTAAGIDPAQAQAQAGAEVFMRPNDPNSFADDSLSAQQQLDYLAARGSAIPVRDLGLNQLRAFLVAAYTERTGPLDDFEFYQVRRAVNNWANSWDRNEGETFLPLLAHALGIQLRVLQGQDADPVTGAFGRIWSVEPVGVQGGPIVDLYYNGGTHYDAAIPAPPQQPAVTQPPAVTQNTQPVTEPGGGTQENAEADPVSVRLPDTPDDALMPWSVDPDANLDHEYGPLAGPKGGQAGAKDWERDAEGNLRVNPLLYRLGDFRPALLDRHDAVWHYAVDEEGEIYLGTEVIHTIVHDDEWLPQYRAHNLNYGDLTPEQLAEELKQFKALVNQQGHPTIAAGYTRDGLPILRSARVSGELTWNAETGRWQANDKSGRYMSEKVRPTLNETDLLRWVGNVARRMSLRFGQPVDGVLVKFNAAPPPPPPLDKQPEPPAPPAPPADQKPEPPADTQPEPPTNQKPEPSAGQKPEPPADTEPKPPTTTHTVNLDAAPIGASDVVAQPVTTPITAPSTATNTAPTTAPATATGSGRVPPNWRLPVEPVQNGHRFDLRQLAADTKQTVRLAQLRIDMSSGVDAPGTNQTAHALGGALATRIMEVVGPDAIGHARLTLEVGTEELAFPGLRLGQVIADNLSHRMLIAVPTMADPVQICPSGARP